MIFFVIGIILNFMLTKLGKKMKMHFLSVILLLSANLVYGHCQVPCGIYDDAVRILLIQEDFSTIKKAMSEIKNYSKKDDPQSLNQLSRWVSTKEDHATNIQNVISSYFLIQRVKSKNSNYVEHLKLLHEVMVYAMKCKQSIDNAYVDSGLRSINKFSKSYLDEHGLEHLKKLSN